MAVVLKKENLVEAKSVSGWNMSLFGQPKLTIICGNCDGQFATREYGRLRDTRSSVACCQFCGKWNRFGLVYG